MGVFVTIELDEAEVITLNEWKPDITAHRYHDVFIGTILAKRVKDALPRPIRVGDKVTFCEGDGRGTVLGINDHMAWVIWDDGGYSTEDVDILEVMP